MRPKKLLFVPFLLFIVSSNLWAQDLMSYTNSLKYADHLFARKEYQLSAIEYQRISYLQPNDTLAKLRLVQSYRLMDDLVNAKLHLNKMFPDCTTECPEDFAIENFRILFLDQQYQDSYRFLLENKTILQPAKTEFEVGTLLMQNKWQEAKTCSEAYLQSNDKALKINDLYNISLKGTQLKYKNPYAAGLLSGIVPGAGKVYTGQWKDGIFAFITVGSLSWLSYRLIKDKGLNVGSIISGSVALSFYTANIFGSYKSAKKQNRKANRELTKDIEKMLVE
ncbi:MAG TPA: hypothetical protein P5084_05035 [Paludibacter sp.]|nr:hypothetical protein [Paludibacter sp.]